MEVCCFGLNGVRYIKVPTADFKCDLNWTEFFLYKTHTKRLETCSNNLRVLLLKNFSTPAGDRIQFKPKVYVGFFFMYEQNTSFSKHCLVKYLLEFILFGYMNKGEVDLSNCVCITSAGSNLHYVAFLPETRVQIHVQWLP